MNHPFIQLTIAQIKEFFREPGALFWSFGFPILMALGLGLAFSGKKEIMHSVAIIPEITNDSSIIKNVIFKGNQVKDSLIEIKFENINGKTRYVFHVCSWNNAEILMKRGVINAILTEDSSRIIYHYDPQNPEGELIQMQLSNFFETGNLGQGKGSIKPLNTKGMRYIDFLIPGLLTMGIMMSVMWGVCYALIEKRSKKLLRTCFPDLFLVKNITSCYIIICVFVL